MRRSRGKRVEEDRVARHWRIGHLVIPEDDQLRRGVDLIIGLCSHQQSEISKSRRKLGGPVFVPRTDPQFAQVLSRPVTVDRPHDIAGHIPREKDRRFHLFVFDFDPGLTLLDAHFAFHGGVSHAARGKQLDLHIPSFREAQGVKRQRLSPLQHPDGKDQGEANDGEQAKPTDTLHCLLQLLVDSNVDRLSQNDTGINPTCGENAVNTGDRG